ncbi:DNA-binding HxlR family transcriptional regulator [Crossiella equi]|uniref:DNA-binding HxlR family transcriptional regulator n=1 Tax=Crossiella equi TaxID=130796 RepID=A0ABS5APN3_9PSEU|nr:helix-turn-helix domain-containing protein [Crossiella equi]MBP2478362.1 DNA-binding HxlR family transcriptional regulator [Crossiella equi]
MTPREPVDAQAHPRRFRGESVGRALDLVGERWTLLILREAFFGVRRYAQFVRNLGIPRPTLSARLKTLVETGLFTKVAYAAEPDRFEYRLTQAGRELFPAIVVLMHWGDRYVPHPDGPPVVLAHNDCGQPADVYLACRHCGGEVGTHSVTAHPGPGSAD